MEKKVTRHGEQRIRERIGVSKKGAERQSELALERGISHGEMKGRLHKWVTSVAMNEAQTRGKYHIYNNKLFIYKSNALITVIPVPSNLHKAVAEQTKKKKV